MKRRIYLSGGMSGVERAEYVRRFGEAEAILRRHGYGCINPCRVWACRWPWIYRAMEWVLGKQLAYAVVLCYNSTVSKMKEDAASGVDTEKDGLTKLLVEARDSMNEVPEL